LESFWHQVAPSWLQRWILEGPKTNLKKHEKKSRYPNWGRLTRGGVVPFNRRIQTARLQTAYHRRQTGRRQTLQAL
jgi:hypothetical protein